MPTADEVIAFLGLKPLPLEGGYYRETYRSKDRLSVAALPAHYSQDKSAATAIYYLLTPDTFSAMHRLPTDEIFHFYTGGPVRMLNLLPDGTGRVLTLGPDVLGGQQPQVVVPRGAWQGCSLEPATGFALLGTTMAPGFDFSDFEAGDRARLIAAYPAHAELIRRLTPESAP